MRPRDVKDLLIKTIPEGMPVLIAGAPGVGKSDIVAQAAAETDADLLVNHPVVSDPTDYKGLPCLVNDQAEFQPFGDLRKLIEAKSRTVCFLDDLGQAPVTVQAAAMQLLLGRQVNGHRISDHVVFIAATNRRQDMAGVTMVLEPLKSRFATIVHLTVNVMDWCIWAREHDVPPEVIAFIRFRPTMLMDTGKPTRDIANRPCPRTVAHVAQLLRAGIDSYDVIAGAVGEAWAVEFRGFGELCKTLPDIDDVLAHPKTASVPDISKPAALYALATALALRAKRETAKAVLAYAERMPEEFMVLLVRDAIKQWPAMQKHSTFCKWAVKHSNLVTE